MQERTWSIGRFSLNFQVAIYNKTWIWIYLHQYTSRRCIRYIYHFWSICLCCGKNTIYSVWPNYNFAQPRYPWNKRFPFQFTTIWWPKTRVFGRDEIWPDSVNTTNTNNSLTQLLPCLAYLLTMVALIPPFGLSCPSGRHLMLRLCPA